MSRLPGSWTQLLYHRAIKLNPKSIRKPFSNYFLVPNLASSCTGYRLFRYFWEVILKTTCQCNESILKFKYLSVNWTTRTHTAKQLLWTQSSTPPFTCAIWTTYQHRLLLGQSGWCWSSACSPGSLPTSCTHRHWLSFSEKLKRAVPKIYRNKDPQQSRTPFHLGNEHCNPILPALPLHSSQASSCSLGYLHPSPCTPSTSRRRNSLGSPAPPAAPLWDTHCQRRVQVPRSIWLHPGQEQRQSEKDPLPPWAHAEVPLWDTMHSRDSDEGKSTSWQSHPSTASIHQARNMDRKCFCGCTGRNGRALVSLETSILK